jgi:hypothetical protein
VTRGYFVTRVDYRNVMRATRLKNRLEVRAVDADNVLDVHRCERPDEQFTACHHGHAEIPLQFVSPHRPNRGPRTGVNLRNPS